jgi:hypothetical protein
VLLPWFAVRRVIDAIAEVVIAGEGGTDIDRPAVADLLERRLRGMAPHARAGMVVATLAIDALARATERCAMSDLDLDGRRRVLDRVRALPGGIPQAALAFYEKMGRFAYWSRVEGASPP